jgi:N4-gp56 family major capsid protein
MSTVVTTLLSDLIDPEVMADSISAELQARIAAKGFMKVDTTLNAKPGSTIVVPRFNYIGPAADLAEGVEGDVEALTTNEKSYTVKKAVKNVELTDEAVLSGFGDPVGETNRQLRMALEDKVDNDALNLLATDGGIYSITTGAALSYEGVAQAMGEFNDEEQGIETYLLVSQEGMKDLRADAKLLGNETLSAELIAQGVVGKIAGANIIISNKLNGTNGTRQAFLLKKDAITAFLKRDVNLETARNVLAKKTLFSVDEHYVCGIENANKVIGITHTNNHLGKLQITYTVEKQSDGTYDATIKSIYPAKFAANTLGYKLGTAPQAVTFDQVINPGTTPGWNALTLGTAIQDVGATPVISIVQVLTADTKAKYFGSVKLV